MSFHIPAYSCGDIFLHFMGENHFHVNDSSSVKAGSIHCSSSCCTQIKLHSFHQSLPTSTTSSSGHLADARSYGFQVLSLLFSLSPNEEDGSSFAAWVSATVHHPSSLFTWKHQFLRTVRRNIEVIVYIDARTIKDHNHKWKTLRVHHASQGSPRIRSGSTRTICGYQSTSPLLGHEKRTATIYTFSMQITEVCPQVTNLGVKTWSVSCWYPPSMSFPPHSPGSGSEQT